jgi:translation initiation factor 1
MPSRRERPIYSTDGRTVLDRRPARCSDCQRPLAACVCSNRRQKHPGLSDGIVRIARDRKQRGGKTVTVVTGLPGDEAKLAELAGRLKRLCGSGGTVKDGAVEVQGDHRERIAEALRTEGYTVKLAGG